MEKRFQDEEKRLTDFYQEVWVKCPSCAQRAVATVDFTIYKAGLYCSHCGYHKTVITGNENRSYKAAAHWYFDEIDELWLQHRFRNRTFLAYNMAHLLYLERYIAATLREHKNRTGFTVLEKLPKFYHDARNREPLLKIVAKLKKK